MSLNGSGLPLSHEFAYDFYQRNVLYLDIGLWSTFLTIVRFVYQESSVRKLTKSQQDFVMENLCIEWDYAFRNTLPVNCNKLPQNNQQP